MPLKLLVKSILAPTGESVVLVDMVGPIALKDIFRRSAVPSQVAFPGTGVFGPLLPAWECGRALGFGGVVVSHGSEKSTTPFGEP